jgi:hypothetical protein
MKCAYFAIILGLYAFCGATATVVPRMSVEQLAADSAWIVHGRVIGSSTGSSGQFIWTHYRVEVLDGLKGGPSREITISEPGGTLNGITMQVEGAVQFEPAEEVVLFLYRTPIGYWRTTGYWQGKVDVIESSGVRRVQTSFGAASAPQGRRKFTARRGADALNGSTLEQFKAQIRSMVR